MTPEAMVLVSALRDGVLTVTLNRPAVLNAITAEMLDGVTAAINAAGDDTGCIVITGAGRAFCAGQDLRLIDESADIGAELRDHYVPLLTAIRTAPVPVIAAVNGVAAGAGLSLAAACDLRIAAESAVFLQAFVRIGLVPDAGGTYLLPRLIGAGRAAEMALLGDPIDAATALQWGLVNRVAADGHLAAQTHEWAARLAAGPRSIRAIKRLMASSFESGLDDQLAAEEMAQTEAAAGADGREGVAAFRDKRLPRFTRR